MDAFKETQLLHRKSSKLLTSELVDFSNPTGDSRIIQLRNPIHSDRSVSSPQAPADPNINTKYRGQLYGLSSHPGFVFAPSALSPSIQDDLAYLALSEYCERPHRTNIDLVPVKTGVEVDDSNVRIWDLWKNENGFSACDNDSNRFPTSSSKPTKRQKKERQRLRPYRSPKKLSWSTLGYHYDWTARSYREDAKSPMPRRLEKLSQNLARLVQSGEQQDASFVASAAIVNYYNTKQVMGGHRDDLEFDFTKPVVSISLGLPAVFLLGGKTRDETPVAMLVRPGDVCFLAGSSRLSYHGMAKAISSVDDIPPVAATDKNLSKFWIDAWPQDADIKAGDNVIPKSSERDAIKAYLLKHRININVRQVLPDGVKKITDDTKAPPDI